MIWEEASRGNTPMMTYCFSHSLARMKKEVKKGANRIGLKLDVPFAHKGTAVEVQIMAMTASVNAINLCVCVCVCVIKHVQ